MKSEHTNDCIYNGVAYSGVITTASALRLETPDFTRSRTMSTADAAVALSLPLQGIVAGNPKCHDGTREQTASLEEGRGTEFQNSIPGAFRRWRMLRLWQQPGG